MILTGSEDLRVRRTIESIKSAFEQMICEMDYSKIRVTELCSRAMINKKTFYVYYPTLDDLLSEIQSEYSAEYIERIKGYKLPDELDKVNREFFLFSEEKGLAYEKITCAGNESLPLYPQRYDKKGHHRRLEQFKEIRRTAGISADHADELRQQLCPWHLQAMDRRR